MRLPQDGEPLEIDAATTPGSALQRLPRPLAERELTQAARVPAEMVLIQQRWSPRAAGPASSRGRGASAGRCR